MTAKVPLIACVAVLAFFAGITGVHLAYTLAYVLVLLLIGAFIWSRALRRRIRVTRTSPQGTYMVGEPFAETFTAENTSALRLPYCEVRDRSVIDGYAPGRAFSLGGGGSVSWTARGVFRSRGRHHFGPLEARLGDPFGLFPHRVVAGEQTEVLVYPAVFPVPGVVPQWTGSSLSDVRRGRPVDVAPDVSTIRDYQPADGLSRIHWRSTAKTGQLMSRVFDTGQNADIMVILDMQRGIHAGEGAESSLEYAVSLAASICHAGLRRAQAVGIVTNDRLGSAIGAGRGETQRLRILEYLATATDNGFTTLADTVQRHGEGWRGRGAVIVITSNRNPAWVEALVDVSTPGQRHLCVFVEPTSFGAKGPALRVPAAWRLALDWWIVRRGDVLGGGTAISAAG